MVLGDINNSKLEREFGRKKRVPIIDFNPGKTVDIDNVSKVDFTRGPWKVNDVI